MRHLFILIIALFTQQQAKAQDWEVITKDKEKPFVSQNKAKIYNQTKGEITLYIKYEGGEWEQKRMPKNCLHLMDLTVCGKGPDEACKVSIRIYHSTEQYTQEEIEGGTRYFIKYQAKRYNIQKVR